MKSRPKKKGSALLTVVMLTAIMAVLTASMLKYSGSEQRSNSRQRLILRSRNMSENVVLYASEQITNKLYRLRSNSPMKFMGANAVTLPPTDVLVTPFSTAADVEVRAGLTTTSGLTYIDPALPANASNPNAGLQVSNSIVPIIAKSTMRHSAIGDVTTYAEQDLEVAMMPLFQFAIFYNMDMEFGPGPNMTISGPVHTNGDFIARIQTGFGNTLKFTDRVTTAKGFYADTAHKGGTYMGTGTLDNGPGGTGPLEFQNPAGTVTPIKSGTGIWRDHKWTSSSTPGSVTENATTQGQFKNFATASYGGNLRTSLHGVVPLKLPDIGDYDESDPVKKKNGRQIIEAPAGSDAGGVLGTKFSRNAGLYIIVNPDATDRTGHLPDGSSVTMRGKSYRSFLNTVNSSGGHVVKEIVLPGQPSYGDLNIYVNNLPNAYRANSAAGSNQVLSIPQGRGPGYVDLAGTGYSWNGGAAPDFDATPTPAELLSENAYFYDMRRGFNQVGYPFNRSASLRMRPRPIAKIDFDMTRFKMAVDRTVFGNTTSTVYFPSVPSDTTTWNASIYNPAGVPASFGLGLATGTNTSYSIFPNRDTLAGLPLSQNAAYAPGTINIASTIQTGVVAASAYACFFKIETSTDGLAYTPAYTSASAETSTSFSPPAGITHVRVSQYNQASMPATSLLDQQVIPVVPDIAPLAVALGGGAASGRYKIWETINANPAAGSTWTLRYTSAADESTISYNPTAGTSGIKVEQFAAGGTVTLVQTQIIPVVNAALTNDRFILPMTNTTTVGGTGFANAVTEMRVYVGGIDDTANWTFSTTAVTGLVSGSLGTNATTTAVQTGSGQFANRYVATAMDPAVGTTTGTVTITAKKPATGGTFTSISRVFTIIKQSSFTVSGANSPAQSGYWLTLGGLVTPDPFKIYLAPVNAAEVATATADPSSFALGTADFVQGGSTPSPWFDGITIYVESVDAEDLSETGTGNSAIRNRVSSGVRLWNGRGSLSTLPGATYPGRTGASFVTNDAVYIVGHYNADGTTDSILTHQYTGGYSGRYPESATEMLTSVMGDALTILSQPEIARGGTAPNYTYPQSAGWSDSMSANVRDTGTYSTSWASSNPSASNPLDGLNAAIQPALLPNQTISSSVLAVDTTAVNRPGPRATSTTAPATRTAKFAPAETEISAALLTGIVPTTVNSGSVTGQTSGGVHNFPRLQENWAGSVALYIRGSLVAMFESRVGTEPWGIRYYSGAIRNWGLHQSLRDANHDVPLEPIVLGARRMSYRELNKAGYEAEKAVIEALP